MGEKSSRPSGKEYAAAWAQATTCHGIVDLYETSHSFLKFLWAVFLVTCFGIAGWQIHGLFTGFLKEPHYDTKSYIKDPRFALFPNVTICNFNRVNSTKAYDYYMDSEVLSYLFSATLSAYEVRSTDEQLHEYEKSWKLWHSSLSPSDQKLSIKDWYSILGFSCEETLIVCEWGGVQFDCCAAEAAKPVLTAFGLCWALSVPSWTFKRGKTAGEPRAKQYATGANNGLKILLEPNLGSYTGNVLINNYLQEGMVVNVNYDPYDFYIQDPIGLSPEKNYWLSMAKREKFVSDPDFQIFPKPCSGGRKLSHIKGEYTERRCAYDCFEAWILENCGCYALADLLDDTAPICNGTVMWTCYIDLPDDSSHDQDPKFRSCSECPPPCGSRHEVSISSSMTDYGGPFVAKLAEHYRDVVGFLNITEEQLSSTISATFYFSTTAQTVIEKDEKTPVFLGLIGQAILWSLARSLLRVPRVPLSRDRIDYERRKR